MSVGHFLAGVGALIYHPPTARYLLLRRASTKDYASGAWDCVSGRVDQGEGFEEALHREVREELGVEVVIDFIIGTTHFYRGQETTENELVGLMYGCSLEDPDAIQISAEHDRHIWVTAAEALEHLGDSPDNEWLRRTLARAEVLRQELPPALLARFRREGFDINSEALPLS